MSYCILCGKVANTKEHIIPRWLQEAFHLSDQRLLLGNDTLIQYNKVVLPFCQDCNGNILSRLENRIQMGTASEMDYYLWALKIRFCLSVKDYTLPLDRKKPSQGTLLSEEKAFKGENFVKHSLLNFEKSDFHFNPNPFGSVFLFDNKLSDGGFGFVDVPEPFWGLTIALPDRKILSVLFTDRGLVKKEVTRLFKNKGGLNRFFKDALQDSTKETVRALMFKMMVWQYKFSNIPYGVSLKPNGVVSQRVPNRPNYRKQLKKEVLGEMSKYLGYSISATIELYNSLPSI